MSSKTFKCSLSSSSSKSNLWESSSLSDAALAEVGVYVGARNIRPGQVWTVRVLAVESSSWWTVKVQAHDQCDFRVIKVFPYRPKNKARDAGLMVPPKGIVQDLGLSRDGLVKRLAPYVSVSQARARPDRNMAFCDR